MLILIEKLKKEENWLGYKLYYPSVLGWLKGTLPDGRAGWVPKNICTEVEDPQARRQNMKNFLLSEEARLAYQMQKATGPHGMFPRVHDYKNVMV